MKTAKLVIRIAIVSSFVAALPVSAQQVGGGGGGGYWMAHQAIEIIRLSKKEVTPERFRQVISGFEGAEDEKASAIVVFDQMMKASQQIR